MAALTGSIMLKSGPRPCDFVFREGMIEAVFGGRAQCICTPSLWRSLLDRGMVRLDDMAVINVEAHLEAWRKLRSKGGFGGHVL